MLAARGDKAQARKRFRFASVIFGRLGSYPFLELTATALSTLSP